MKKSVHILTILLSVGTPVAFLSLSGCAGTSTRESTGEYVDDSALTGKVKAAFAKDDDVKARDVQVETFKGTVQLSGFVNTAEEKSRAAQIAKGVPGVKSVKNNITVK
jgi:hyperosmotically inducible protein